MAEPTPFDFTAQMLQRYPAGEYACFFEVRNATGFRGDRSADALVMGLWPSRGLQVEGFELKSFRSDWLRELKNPAKAEKHFRHCDRWWLVTASDSIADEAEVPSTWGWLSWNGKKLRQLKAAPQNPDVQPIGRPYLAAILRAAQAGLEETARAKASLLLAPERETMRADLEHQLGGELRTLKHEHDTLKEVVEQFEEHSGIKLSEMRWRRDAAYAARAYRAATAINLQDYVDEAAGLAKRLAGQAQSLEEALRLYREGEARHG